MSRPLLERGGNGAQIFITGIWQDQAGANDEPSRSGAGAIEIVPADAHREDDISDDLLEPVAFWCAVCQA